MVFLLLLFFPFLLKTSTYAANDRPCPVWTFQRQPGIHRTQCQNLLVKLVYEESFAVLVGTRCYRQSHLSPSNSSQSADPGLPVERA